MCVMYNTIYQYYNSLDLYNISELSDLNKIILCIESLEFDYNQNCVQCLNLYIDFCFNYIPYEIRINDLESNIQYLNTQLEYSIDIKKNEILNQTLELKKLELNKLIKCKHTLDTYLKLCPIHTEFYTNPIQKMYNICLYGIKFSNNKSYYYLSIYYLKILDFDNFVKYINSTNIDSTNIITFILDELNIIKQKHIQLKLIKFIHKIKNIKIQKCIFDYINPDLIFESLFKIKTE